MKSIIVLAVVALAASASAMPTWWPATGQTKVSTDYIVAGTCPQTMSVQCPTQYGMGCCPNGSICGNGSNKCQKGYCCAATGATCDTALCVGQYDASWCKEQFICPFGQICCSSGSTCFTWADGSVGCKVACFSGDSYVTVESGRKLLSEVKIGDKVLALNTKTNQFEFSDVYAFLDVDRKSTMEFVNLVTSNGAEISLTAEHLIMSARPGAVAGQEQLQAIAARRVLVGDLVQLSNGEVVAVEKISLVQKVGAYAPATVLGTIVINDVVSSCYAYVAHEKAHAAMAPLRWLWESTPSILIEETPKEGVHWYSNFLMKRFQGLLDIMV